MLCPCSPPSPCTPKRALKRKITILYRVINSSDVQVEVVPWGCFCMNSTLFLRVLRCTLVTKYQCYYNFTPADFEQLSETVFIHPVMHLICIQVFAPLHSWELLLWVASCPWQCLSSLFRVLTWWAPQRCLVTMGQVIFKVVFSTPAVCEPVQLLVLLIWVRNTKVLYFFLSWCRKCL